MPRRKLNIPVFLHPFLIVFRDYLSTYTESKPGTSAFLMVLGIVILVLCMFDLCNLLCVSYQLTSPICSVFISECDCGRV